MKTSLFATVALAGASVLFGAPQSDTSKPATQTSAKKHKKTKHKKQAKQQTPASTTEAQK
jgi:hypothetical protein